MFLLIAHRRSVRRLQLKELLVLILRMLIIMLIALALARPLLKNKFSFASAHVRTSCVIILDNSYSMDYADITGRRFDQAKENARFVLDSLQQGDSASLILMSDDANIIFQKLTMNLAQVRAAIDNAAISQRPTRVLAAIQAAYTLLENAPNPNKEIYLITDLGKNGWENWQSITSDLRANIYILRVGETDADNTAIEEISLANQLINTNTPVRLQAKISNFSETPLKDVLLTLKVDGQKRREASISVPAKDSVLQSFTHRFQLPGSHVGELSISNDRLAIDNTRYFVVNVSGQIRALCVGSQTLYLTLALNPTTVSSPGNYSAILPTASSVAELMQIPLDEYDAVISTSLSLPENSMRRLHNFVRDGKSILLFASEELSGEANFMEVAPAKFGNLHVFQNPLKLTEYDKTHPIFEVFNPKGLSAPNFYKAFELTLLPDSKDIAKFSNGILALVERPVGLGKVILFNTSAYDFSWSNLPLNQTFLPLLQQAIFYVTQKEEAKDKNIIVGGVYSKSLRLSPRARIQPPGENTATVVVATDENGKVKFKDTNAAGIYRLEVQTADKVTRDFFAVNVDTRESDLTTISEAEVGRKLNTNVSFIDDQNGIVPLAKIAGSYRTGREIWGELLILALVLMFTEIVLANRAK